MSKSDVLKQLNLTSRPNVHQSIGAGSAGEENTANLKDGLIINVVRRLPAEVFKRSRNLSEHKTVIAERVKEFEPELPVEAAEAAEAGAAASGAAASSSSSSSSSGPRRSARRSGAPGRSAPSA